MKTRVTEINESEYGLYVWEMPNGAVVANEDREYLSVASKVHDAKKMRQLEQAVRSFGITIGRAKFLPGRRKVTRSEWEDMNDRMNSGLIPDPYEAP